MQYCLQLNRGVPRRSHHSVLFFLSLSSITVVCKFHICVYTCMTILFLRLSLFAGLPTVRFGFLFLSKRSLVFNIFSFPKSTMAGQDALIRSAYRASAATWPFTTVSTILFSIKIFSRVRLQRDVAGWDDLVISVSWVNIPPRYCHVSHTPMQDANSFVKQVLDIIRAAAFQKALTSTRKITPDNLPDTVPTAAFWVIFTDAWAFLSIALPKLGIGILIIRIFRPQRWLRVSIMTLCITLNILAIVGFIITFVQCDPAAGQWDPWRYPQARCWKRDIQIIYSCTVSGMYLQI